MQSVGSYDMDAIRSTSSKKLDKSISKFVVVFPSKNLTIQVYPLNGYRAQPELSEHPRLAIMK